MKLSTRGRYGMRLMVDLAQHYAEGPVTLKAIAERQELSAKYLEQLIIPLRAAGLIRSVRGRQGGYLLARKAENISAGQILKVVEGEFAFFTPGALLRFFSPLLHNTEVARLIRKVGGNRILSVRRKDYLPS